MTNPVKSERKSIQKVKCVACVENRPECYNLYM